MGDETNEIERQPPVHRKVDMINEGGVKKNARTKSILILIDSADQKSLTLSGIMRENFFPLDSRD